MLTDLLTILLAKIKSVPSALAGAQVHVEGTWPGAELGSSAARSRQTLCGICEGAWNASQASQQADGTPVRRASRLAWRRLARRCCSRRARRAAPAPRAARR